MIKKLVRDFSEWPHWKKGTMFYFELDSGMIWGMKDRKTTNSYPLRKELSAYLWLLNSEKKLFKLVTDHTDKGAINDV